MQDESHEFMSDLLNFPESVNLFRVGLFSSVTIQITKLLRNPVVNFHMQG